MAMSILSETGDWTIASRLPRGDVPALLNVGARQARRIVSTLLERGVLASKNTRAPLSLVFPATLAPRWMPGLFPERTS